MNNANHILRALLRIRDVYPRSRIRILPSRIPDQNISDLRSRIHIHIEDIKVFLSNPKKLFLSARKYNPIRIPNLIFYASRVPGSKRYQIPDPDPQHCLRDTTKWTPSRKIHAAMQEKQTQVGPDISCIWSTGTSEGVLLFLSCSRFRILYPKRNPAASPPPPHTQLK